MRDPLPLARRLEAMGEEGAFRVRARALELERAGRDVIHLEMGEPDFPTPAPVLEATVRALRDGHTGYAPGPGIPRLREAIAHDAGRRRGLRVDPERVVVCPGAKPVIFFTFLALVERGDRVVLPDPGFPIFGSMARALGADVRTYDPGGGARARPDLDRLARLLEAPTRLLVLNSPGNPTGVVFRPEELETVAALCRRRGVIVLSDEIYSEILFEGEHRSIAACEGMTEHTVVLDGFSKTWSMPGFRLGYAIAPPALAAAFAKLVNNSVSCAVHFAQYAGLAALEGGRDEVRRRVGLLAARRDALMGGLAELPGVRCARPEGAFFAFLDVRDLGVPSRTLAARLLEEQGVAVVAGEDFGKAGAGHLRVSLTASGDRIREALGRFRNLLSA